jgi:hypothetical protein
MRVLITQDIPNKVRVEKGGIHRVIRQTRSGSIYIRSITRELLKVKPGEFVIVEGGKMKLSELARCAKYLEILHLKMMQTGFKSRSNMNPPIESFLLNEFPHGSAFCYLFRGTWTAKKVRGLSTCFCPKRPFDHSDWGQSRIPNSPGLKATEPPHVNCRLLLDGSCRSIDEMIREVEALEIGTIMKFLSRAKIPPHKVRHMCTLWHFHVWQRVIIGHLDRADENDFTELYKR